MLALKITSLSEEWQNMLDDGIVSRLPCRFKAIQALGNIIAILTDYASEEPPV
jgi:hypothetical protein